MLIAYFVLCNLSVYSQAGSTYITFWKSQKTGQNNVTGEYVMENYLSQDEDWVESIECVNVNTHTKMKGLILLANDDNEEKYSEVLINFNEKNLMKVNKLILYINKVDQSNPIVEIYMNEQQISLNNLQSLKPATDATGLSINNISTYCLACPMTKEIDGVPMQSLRIKNYYNSKGDSDVQLLGFKVNYSGIADDFTVGVEEMQYEDGANVEYYDMLGRKLAVEPNSGLYIVRSNGKSKKILKT